MNAPPQITAALRADHGQRGGIDYYEVPDGLAGTAYTIQQMQENAVACAGHLPIKRLANDIVADVEGHDGEGEAEAIFAWVKNTHRYTRDPIGTEWIQCPCWTAWVEGHEDCFTHGTKVLLREGMRLVPVESLRVGDEIWGYNRWSKVIGTADKGILPTWRIQLNNGGSMRLTPDHHVFWGRCKKHGTKTKPCSCRMDARELVRIRVDELRPKMAVLCPESVDYGIGEMDPDRAYIEGLYLSDGWSDYKRGGSRFCISGRDGHPKEEQKREVARICKSLGIKTGWHRRYIRVYDRDWTQRLASMGEHAPQKRALSIDFQKETADELLRGIMADAGKNTNGNAYTFTTTSYDLWLQTRVLLKMQGMECSSWFIRDHGGLGKNPIWRLATRDKTSRTRSKLLRVKEVQRDEVPLPCCDIETDDHYVWLPEADWTVSQCDGLAALVAALALATGNGAAYRTIAADPRRPGEMSHVYALIGVRVKGQERWFAADVTQPQSYLGWEPRVGVTHVRDWVISGP